MRPDRRQSQGFTYVEVLLSVVILAGAVASMSLALQSSRDVGEDAAQMGVPRYLVQDGIVWVWNLARTDPDQPPSFGSEAGETPATFDDVDDLDGLVESPVTDLAAETFGPQWSRTFVVESVLATAPSVPVAPGSTNLMRLRVSVLRNGAEAAAAVVLFWRPQ